MGIIVSLLNKAYKILVGHRGLMLNSFRVKRMEAVEVGSPSIEDEGLETDAGGGSSFKDGGLAISSIESKSFKERDFESSSVGSDSIKERDLDAAAVKLQKVYRSYRTRRNLADCAVVAEELWWRAIDSATLKRNTVSFFHIDKPETAGHRWSRAGLIAAKVGKGLSKDDNALKLALEHWIEAIDPRHRYGHNLHFYYDAWVATDTDQPFFYWLDVGDGRDLNLKYCPRRELQQQRIKYLGPKERERYEIVPKDGKLVYKQTGQLVDTTKGSYGSKWIFVMSTSKQIYAGQKQKGKFQHSSFLAGGATSAAGRFIVEDGILKSVSAYSGHYHPTEQNLNEVLSYLEENGIDLTNVQKGTYDEDEHSFDPEKYSMTESRHNSQAEREEYPSLKKLEGNVVQKAYIDNKASNGKMKIGTALCSDGEQNRTDDAAGNTLRPLQQVDLNQKAHNDNDRHLGLVARTMSEGSTEMMGTIDKQDNQERISYKRSLSDDLENKTEIPESSLLQRINSKKAIKSYQLGKQLSLKWSTGVGPRIGCVADYPAELRFMALEKVNLSPRGITPSSYQSPRCKYPTIYQSPQVNRPVLDQEINV